MSDRKILLTSESEGRLDSVIADLSSFSRSRAASMIKEGGVSVNGIVITKPAFLLKGGEEIEINVPRENVSFEKPSKDIDIGIVYEDDDVLVINKPRGLVVHPAPGHHDDTLVN